MKEELHFKIEGEWLTDFIRNMWYSEKPKKAHDILVEEVGLSSSQALDIIFGKLKLIGINELYLEDELDNDQLIENKHDGFFTVKNLTKKIENKIIESVKFEKNISTEELENLEFLYEKFSENSNKNLEFFKNNLPELTKDHNDPNTFEWNEFTDRGIDLWCSRNSYARAQNKAMENYYIKKFGQEIFETSLEIKLNSNNQNKIIDIKKQISEFNSIVDKFHGFIKNKRYLNSDAALEHDNILEKYKKLSFLKSNFLINDILKFPIPKFINPLEEFPRNGYITPDGKFFKTYTQGHVTLDEELLESNQITYLPGWCIRHGSFIDWQNAGWIKISNGEICRGFSNEIAYLEKWKDPFPEKQKETLLELLLSVPEKSAYTWWKLGSKTNKVIDNPMELIESIVNDLK